MIRLIYTTLWWLSITTSALFGQALDTLFGDPPQWSAAVEIEEGAVRGRPLVQGEALVYRTSNEENPASLLINLQTLAVELAPEPVLNYPHQQLYAGSALVVSRAVDAALEIPLAEEDLGRIRKGNALFSLTHQEGEAYEFWIADLNTKQPRRLCQIELGPVVSAQLLNVAAEGSPSDPQRILGLIKARSLSLGLPEYHLFCYDGARKQLTWHRKEPKLSAPTSDNINFAVVKNRAVVVTDLKVVAIDLETGTIEWEIEGAATIEAVNVDFSNETVVFATRGLGTTAIDLGSGKRLWSNLEVQPWEGDLQFSPTGRLFALCQESLSLVELHPRTGAFLWTTSPSQGGEPHLGSLQVTNSYLTTHAGRQINVFRL